VQATFDNDLEEEALAKRHSTTREAVTAGASAGAFRTILTHFSQRYPKMPVVDETFTDRTCVAFDMMSLNVADLVVVPRLMSVLKILFRETEADAEAEADEVEK
jgi:ribonuclease Z